MMTSSEGPLFSLASGPPTLNPPLGTRPPCPPPNCAHESTRGAETGSDQYVAITNSQRHEKRMVIVIHFNLSRSFFAYINAGNSKLSLLPKFWGPRLKLFSLMVNPHLRSVFPWLRFVDQTFSAFYSLLHHVHILHRRDYDEHKAVVVALTS